MIWVLTSFEASSGMNFRDGTIIMLLLWQDHSKLILVLSTGKNICHHVTIMKCVIATSPIRKKRGSCNGCHCNYYNIIQSSVLGTIISGFIFAQTTKTSSPDKMFWIIKRTEALKTWKFYLCMFAEKTFQLSFGSLRGLKIQDDFLSGTWIYSRMKSKLFINFSVFEGRIFYPKYWNALVEYFNGWRFSLNWIHETYVRYCYLVLGQPSRIKLR